MADWYRVLDSPSLLDKSWYKNVRAPPIVELETYKDSYRRSRTLPNVLSYECINCSVPVFTCYDGREMAVNEFAAGVKEEFLIFKAAFGVDICTDSITFNENIFYVATCECGTELGYFVGQMRNDYTKWLNGTYLARGKRVRRRRSTREMKLMEFVKSKARSVLTRLQKKRLSSGKLKPILTPEFVAVAGSAAVDVANRVLGSQPQPQPQSLIEEAVQAETGETSHWSKRKKIKPKWWKDYECATAEEEQIASLQED